MRKCVICGDWAGRKMAGVQRYALQILSEIDDKLKEGNLDLEFELLIPAGARWAPPFQRIKVVERGGIVSRPGKYFWQQLVFPQYVRREKAIGIDLALAMPFFGCDVCAIHDCIPENYPENFAGHEAFLKIYLAKVRRAVRDKKREIITVSECSKNELIRQYAISEDRISIVSNGWEHMESIREDMGVFDRLASLKKGEYFFSLGSKYRHKNFAWILRAAHRNPQSQFVVTGEDSYSEEGKNLMSLGESNVLFTGYVTDGELKALIRHCRALIQPSLYEGFGIPPLEALSLGKSIIVSNTSCLPEIYKDSAYYIDPYSDGCDLDELLTAPAGDAEPILKEYSWKNSADQLLRVIDKVQARRQSR